MRTHVEREEFFTLVLQEEVTKLRRLVRLALAQGVEEFVILDQIFDALTERAANADVARLSASFVAEMLRCEFDKDGA